ncbi:succinate--CoA ligase subunit alpha [Candidatus Parvarchaeota archaeon]|nr:succinate--CoA ligase subunit alpha [Candidatus Parvarchaeota archaeon]
MGIIIGRNTRVIVQGITGHQGSFHTKAMINFGTKIVAGVTPGKGGRRVCGVPVYDSVENAVEKTNADSAVVFVPAPYVLDAVLEDIDSGIRTIVIITEHVPFHDMLKIKEYAGYKHTLVIGPNCPGIASPGYGKLGIIPNSALRPGNVGVVSRSGTLTYEIVNSLSESGLGQSTVVGIGGDKVPGTSFIDILEMFQNDDKTKAVVMVGEIGGSSEEDAARFIEKNVSKPVFAFISGKFAPKDKRMGHAGAIISGKKGSAESKIYALKRAGVEVVEDIYLLRKLIK